MNVSKISLNLLTEEVYLKGMVNNMFENIIKEQNEPSSPKEKHLVKKVAEDFKLNMGLLFTYSVGISGFVGPVMELLGNQNIKVTSYDVTLIVMVVFYILLKGSNDDIEKMVSSLREKKLDKQVKPVLNFISKSLTLFKVIGKKFGIAITTLTDILAFTFLSVPILGTLKDLAAEKGFNLNNIDVLLTGVALSAGTYALKNIIKRK
jgi:hypothetical protein